MMMMMMIIIIIIIIGNQSMNSRCVGVQFYPWFNFYFPLFLGMVMHDSEFKTKENFNLAF